MPKTMIPKRIRPRLNDSPGRAPQNEKKEGFWSIVTAQCIICFLMGISVFFVYQFAPTAFASAEEYYHEKIISSEELQQAVAPFNHFLDYLSEQFSQISFDPDQKPEVNHKNANKSDNRVENLEWRTTFENYAHARDMGLFKPENWNKGEYINGG